MKKIKGKIFGIILIIFSFFQILYIYQLKNKSLSVQSITYEANESTQIKEKSLSAVIQDISRINNVNITEATQDEERCYLKVKIIGNKDDILEGLSGLTGYNINGYNISHTASNNSLILEIMH